MPSREPRKWSSLSPATKAFYRTRGIKPATYNAWQRLTPAQKRAANEAAVAKGYSLKSGDEKTAGMRRRAAEAVYRRVTGKSGRRLDARQIAIALLRAKYPRNLVGQLFRLPPTDEEWKRFLYPANR